MPEFKGPQKNTKDSSIENKKQSKVKVLDDKISKGRTATGQKPDEIILNPVLESVDNTRAWVAFGRHQPFTKEGHGKVLSTVESGAEKEGAQAHFITSHSEGTGKNPIPAKVKVKLIKKVAKPSTQVYSSDENHPSLLHQLSKMYAAGVRHVTYVGGSDRVGAMTDLIKKYNGVRGPHGYFELDSVNSKSSGERDPDAEGTKGVSGTKVRAMARAGDEKGFKENIPKELHPHAKEMMDHIKSIKEDVDNDFDQFVLTNLVEEIGKVYDKVINHSNTHFRDDATTTKTTLYKHDTPGEPKSSLVKDDLNFAFENWVNDENPDPKYREVVNRHGQDRKKIQLVPRDNRDRKQDDRPYRQQSIVKKIIDEEPELTFGKGPPSNMSSPSNDLTKQQVKLPKVTMPDFKSKLPSKLPNVNDFTPDMFKSEAYGRGYVSPTEKIRRAMAQRGVNIDSDKHAKENERLKAQYQDILDREAKEKKEKNESVNSAGSGGVRGMGSVTGNPDGESSNYSAQNVADAETRNDLIKAHINAHFAMHVNNADIVDTPDSDTEDQIMNKNKKKVDEQVDPVKHLEDKLNTATDKSYKGIDKLMRGVAKDHNIDVHDLHNMWVKKAGCTPDEYVNEDLRKWFSKTDPEGGWKRLNSKGEVIGPCAREPGEAKPKCMSNEKRARLTKKQRAAAVRAKRKHDPNAERKGSPINVSNFGKGKISEDKGWFEKTAKQYSKKLGISLERGKKIAGSIMQKMKEEAEEMPEAKNWAQQAAIAIAMQKAKKKPKNEEVEIKEVTTELMVRAANLALDKSEISRKKANQKVNDLNKITDDSNKIVKGKEKEADSLSKEINDLSKHSEVKNKQAKFFMRAAARKQVKEELENLEEKNSPTNPALWSRAKALARSKFDVYPSAYANGWAAKWYKSKGGGWKSTNEEVESLDEISNELIGKVNKIRTLQGPNSKTKTASDTLNKAVEKVRARTEVGKVK